MMVAVLLMAVLDPELPLGRRVPKRLPEETLDTALELQPTEAVVTLGAARHQHMASLRRHLAQAETILGDSRQDQADHPILMMLLLQVQVSVRRHRVHSTRLHQEHTRRRPPQLSVPLLQAPVGRADGVLRRLLLLPVHLLQLRAVDTTEHPLPQLMEHQRHRLPADLAIPTMIEKMVASSFTWRVVWGS
jgi:hypothetical protein